MSGRPEVWLRGPLEGYGPHLMPVAHALLQASEDLEAASGLSHEQLWQTPGGAASAGFHLRHIAGSIDRLLSYAQGGQLSEAQLDFLRHESDPGADADTLIAGARAAIEGALEVLRRTPGEKLLEARGVGRRNLPSTVLGLLYHIGEHTSRHAGQLITTCKVVRGG